MTPIPSGPRPTSHPVRRSLVSTVAAALALAAALVLAPAGTPVGASGPLPAYATAAEAAADWIEADYIANGGSYMPGMYADVVFALAATDGSQAVAEDALLDLEAVTAGYINPGGGSYWNAGGIAKVMLAVQTLGGDVTDFAGFDLEAVLRGLIVPSGGDAGRIGNSSTFTQPLGIMALARTTGGAPAATGTWLAAKQCGDGGYSWGSCAFADADYTGIAAQALMAAGLSTEADDALDWLEDNQGLDGGFHASNEPGDSNANSTGLAVQALRADGRTVLANDGADYVAGLQYTAGTDEGAIPWMALNPGDLLLATTQGVLAWGAEPFDQLTLP